MKQELSVVLIFSENVILASKFENNEGYMCIILNQNLQDGWMSNCRDMRGNLICFTSPSDALVQYCWLPRCPDFKSTSNAEKILL